MSTRANAKPYPAHVAIAHRARGDRVALLRQLVTQLGDFSARLPELLGELIDKLIGCTQTVTTTELECATRADAVEDKTYRASS